MSDIEVCIKAPGTGIIRINELLCFHEKDVGPKMQFEDKTIREAVNDWVSDSIHARLKWGPINNVIRNEKFYRVVLCICLCVCFQTHIQIRAHGRKRGCAYIKSRMTPVLDFRLGA